MSCSSGYNGKKTVFGMREVGGRVRAMPVDGNARHDLQHHILINVEHGSTIYTDEWSAYRNLSTFYTHKTVKHKDGEYVKDGFGTQGIESVWAVLKRGLHGTYHHCDEKHLARYVNEFAFRLGDGNVKTHVLLRMNALVDQCVGKRLTYEA